MLLEPIIGACVLMNLITLYIVITKKTTTLADQKNVPVYQCPCTAKPTMKVKLLRTGAHLPKKGSPGAAGHDVYACIEAPIIIKARHHARVPLGIAIEIPGGFVAYMAARSGLAWGSALSLLAAIVYSDYRGEIRLIVQNNSDVDVVIQHGQRVGQLVMLRHESPIILESDYLPITERGEGAFGSTGV
jgi:dUTP pyrophosphatase